MVEDIRIELCKSTCLVTARSGFAYDPRWWKGRIEAACNILTFCQTDVTDQRTLDAISHANESLYLIRSGTV